MQYNQLAKLYRDGCSLREIAKQFDISHMQVKRILKKMNEPLRDSSEAQCNFLKNNPDKHPTKGKKRTLEERLKISSNLSKGIEAEKIEERRAMGIERWKNKTKTEKETVRKKCMQAFRNASTYGSKLERFLVAKLSEKGVSVEFHKEFLLENEKMHIDIFLPDKLIAIEVDGPSHHLPIFGQEKLEKQQHADTEKNGLLLAKGISIFRIKNIHNKLNLFLKYQLLDELMDKINSNSVPELIYIEVSKNG